MNAFDDVINTVVALPMLVLLWVSFGNVDTKVVPDTTVVVYHACTLTMLMIKMQNE